MTVPLFVLLLFLLFCNHTLSYSLVHSSLILSISLLYSLLLYLHSFEAKVYSYVHGRTQTSRSIHCSHNLPLSFLLLLKLLVQVRHPQNLALVVLGILLQHLQNLQFLPFLWQRCYVVVSSGPVVDVPVSLVQ